MHLYTHAFYIQVLMYLHIWASPVAQQKSICLQCRRHKYDPWVGKIPWKRKWHATPGFLPGKSHGQRRLAGYSPWCHKESDTTERTQMKELNTLPCAMQ